MSEEIDLQVYLAALRRRWWVVLGALALALGISLAITAAQPKHYQATATLLAQAPRYQWRFDAGILPLVDVRRDYQREFLAISKSNQIATQAAESLQASGEVPGATPNGMQAAVSVRAADGATLLVTATAGDPGQAAAIANAWSDAFVDMTGELYGVSADLAAFQAELEAAKVNLDQIEEELADVRSETGIYSTGGDSLEVSDAYSPRQAQLNLVNQSLAQYRMSLDTLRYFGSLLEESATGSGSVELPLDLLSDPIVSQRGVLTAEVVRANLDNPGALQALVAQEEEALAATAEQLASQSEQLQSQLAADWQRYGEVNRQQNLARETHNLLSRKVDEASIQQRVDPGQLIMVSEALPPDSPVQTRQIAQLAVAGVIGLIVGVLLALWLEFRRKGPEPAHASSEPDQSEVIAPSVEA